VVLYQRVVWKIVLFLFFSLIVNCFLETDCKTFPTHRVRHPLGTFYAE
jgi:hypothetical protein